MKKLIFNFNKKEISSLKNSKNILGGKGANLSEMTNLGFPVPPGFIISTEVCEIFYKNNKSLNKNIIKEIFKELKKIEINSGKKLGTLRKALEWVRPMKPYPTRPIFSGFFSLMVWIVVKVRISGARAIPIRGRRAHRSW